MRTENRTLDGLRKIELKTNVNKFAEGSCLACFGDTQVLCTATLEEKIPAWLKNQGKGWVTAEYGMLPRSTDIRMDREAIKGSQGGRTQEIQRLISRSLRACVDLRKIADMSIKIDCDVIQADGGTRTAAITGGYVALYQAFQFLHKSGIIGTFPIINSVSAISCGFVDGRALLDLDYQEDSHADTDCNFVITGNDALVEVQGTAEGKPFSRQDFNTLLDLAFKGCHELKLLQMQALGIDGNNI